VVTESIFVVGDIARFPHVLYEYQFLVLEHWDNAVLGAEVARRGAVFANFLRRRLRGDLCVRADLHLSPAAKRTGG
jgi:hypothetical protein